MSARSAKEYGTKKKKGEFAGIRYDLDKSSSSANNRVIKYQERECTSHILRRILLLTLYVHTATYRSNVKMNHRNEKSNTVNRKDICELCDLFDIKTLWEYDI